MNRVLTKLAGTLAGQIRMGDKRAIRLGKRVFQAAIRHVDNPSSKGRRIVAFACLLHVALVQGLGDRAAYLPTVSGCVVGAVPRRSSTAQHDVIKRLRALRELYGIRVVRRA